MVDVLVLVTLVLMYLNKFAIALIFDISLAVFAGVDSAIWTADFYWNSPSYNSIFFKKQFTCNMFLLAFLELFWKLVRGGGQRNTTDSLCLIVG